MKIATNVADALKLLWQDKFFFQAKDARSIETELSKRGYNFVDKALMMALMRTSFLTRKGQKGNYSYIQKHPYFQESKDDSPKINRSKTRKP
jgi:hypothetical protein